jgi:hypothetical protein
MPSAMKPDLLEQMGLNELAAGDLAARPWTRSSRRSSRPSGRQYESYAALFFTSCDAIAP